MLVLSRGKNETIMIGDDIEITIIDVKGEKVRVGIKAPRTVQVHRKEVYDAIRSENIAASKVCQSPALDLGALGALLGKPATEADASQKRPGKKN